MLDSVPQNNIEAVKHFVSNGGTFVVVSGRNPDEIAMLKEIMPIYDLCVCSNGTAVYSISEKRAVEAFTMNEEAADPIKFFANRMKTFEYLRVTDNDFAFKFLTEDVEEFLKQPRFPIYKMIIEHSDRAEADRNYVDAKKLFGDRFNVDRSLWRTLEVCPKGSGKGEAIKKMLPLMGRKFDKIVCVGDNENDIGMIELADIGYAVGNAVDELKAVADRVTVSCAEGAIAAIVEEI